MIHHHVTSTLSEISRQYLDERQLSNTTSIDAQCNTTIVSYNDLFNMDDTSWTYWTNYLICSVAIGILIHLSPEIQPKPKDRKYVFYPSSEQRPMIQYQSSLFVLGFFFFSWLVYGLAGLSCHFSITIGSWQEQLLARCAYVLVILGASCLNGESVLYLEHRPHLSKGCLWIWGLANGAVLLAAAVTGILFICGTWLFLSSAFNAVLQIRVFLRSRVKACLLKASGMTLSSLGLVLRVVLDGTCGSVAQATCFADCILPNASYFNHNAVFHLVIVASLALFGLGETLAPAHTLIDIPLVKGDVEENTVTNSFGPSSLGSRL